MELDRVLGDCSVVDWGWVMDIEEARSIYKSVDDGNFAVRYDGLWVEICESIDGKLKELEEKLRNNHGELRFMMIWNENLITLVGEDAGERPDITHERVVRLKAYRELRSMSEAPMDGTRIEFVGKPVRYMPHMGTERLGGWWMDDDRYYDPRDAHGWRVCPPDAEEGG